MGLNTSSEPRESLGNGGIRVDGISDSSSIDLCKLIMDNKLVTLLPY